MDCSALAYRIEDGGDKAKNEQPADFAFFGNSGRCCHIECKETADFQPFELRRIEGHQIDWLTAFEGLSVKFEGWVAFGWRAVGRPMESVLVMVPAARVASYEADHGRRSIPMDDARWASSASALGAGTRTTSGSTCGISRGCSGEERA